MKKEYHLSPECIKELQRKSILYGCIDLNELIIKRDGYDLIMSGLVVGDYTTRPATVQEALELIEFILIRGDGWLVDRIRYDPQNNYHYFLLSSGERLRKAK